MDKIFLSPPHMGTNEQKYIDEVFKSNYIAPIGEFVDKFEESIQKYCNIPYALATINATSALHLALLVLGVKADDNVLVSTFTFIGGVNPIKYIGANPIFVDSDESWNISPILIENAIKKHNPKVLVLTHLYGQMAKMDEIMIICKKYNIKVIEDSAESLGASLKGQQSGTFGDMGIFSFNGNKILTTSGGGMLVSNNKNLIAKAKFLSTQAKENEPWYEHKEVGYNYRMSNILAAVGVAQMEVLDERISKKREIFSWYKKLLDEDFMPEIENSLGNRWLTTLQLKNKNPEKIIKELAKHNIESRFLWKPMHLQPIFKNSINVVDGTSKNMFDTGICLPSGTTLKKKDVKNICKIINE